MGLHRLPAAALWAIFLSASVVTAYDWSFLTSDSTKQFRIDEHAGILGHTARPPDTYRVLVPYLLEGPIRMVARTVPYEKAFGRVYAVYYWIAMAGLLYAQYAYFMVFFTEEQALVGALAIAATLPITLRYFDYAPYSLLEPTFFALGLILIYRERYGWLAALVFLASLNRETGIFLVFFFMAVRGFDRRHLTIGLGYLALWAVIVEGLRLVLGGVPRYWTIAQIWRANTADPASLAIAAVSVVLFLGAYWVFAALGFKHAPAFVRKTALVVPVYVVAVGVWGVWIEVRLLQSMYPVLMPLALSYLFQART